MTSYTTTREWASAATGLYTAQVEEQLGLGCDERRHVSDVYCCLMERTGTLE